MLLLISSPVTIIDCQSAQLVSSAFVT